MNEEHGCKELGSKMSPHNISQIPLGVEGLFFHLQAGLEILKSIPHNHTLIVNFYKSMFLACSDHQAEILLNFALYLVLRQRDVVEGLELLKSKANKPQFQSSILHKAYMALFEALLHQPKKTESTGIQGM